MELSHNTFYISFSLKGTVVYFDSQQTHPAVCVYKCFCVYFYFQITYLIPKTPCSSLLSTDMVNTKTTFGGKV